MTWTTETEAKLREYLASHELPVGIGNKESACSISEGKE